MHVAVKGLLATLCLVLPWSISAQKAPSTSTPAASSGSAAPAVTLRQGIVQFDAKGTLTLVTPSPVPTGGAVHFQYPGETGEAACCRRLPLSAFRKVRLPAGTATDMASGRPVAALRARAPAPDAEMPFLGAAVLGDVQSVTMAPGDGLAARAKDGGTTASTTCISAEGFQVIEKGPSKGKPRTHLYLNLGYEVEDSTCR